jgi:hypothetical protein
MAGLTRFWFVLDDPRSGLGYGVTAYDEADARDLIQRLIFQAAQMPPVLEVVSDVKVPDLDQGHVVPNMNPPNWRGVWFPKGFSGDGM